MGKVEIEDLQLEHVAPDKLRPYDKNPRSNDHVVDALIASIKEHGFRTPILVDQNYRICSGHTRWKAATKMGLLKVPVVVAHMDEKTFIAYNIADNRLSESAEWDWPQLRVNLEELGYESVRVIAATGMSQEELDRLYNLGLDTDLSQDAPPEHDWNQGNIGTVKFLYIEFKDLKMMERVRKSLGMEGKERKVDGAVVANRLGV